MRRALMAVPLALLMGLAPALAGKAETGDPGESLPTPSPGKEIEISFNPKVRVVVEHGDDIFSLFQKLRNEVTVAAEDRFRIAENPADGEAPVGIEIFRDDGSELDQLAFRENDPALTTNSISLDHPGLMARIRRFQEDAAGGQIFVRVNDRDVSLQTEALVGRTAVDGDLLTAVRDAGFEAHLEPQYLVITKDRNTGQGIRRIGVRSTDAGIVSSEIELLLNPNTQIPTLSPLGFAALALLLAAAGAFVLRRNKSAV